MTNACNEIIVLKYPGGKCEGVCVCMCVCVCVNVPICRKFEFLLCKLFYRNLRPDWPTNIDWCYLSAGTRFGGVLFGLPRSRVTPRCMTGGSWGLLVSLLSLLSPSDPSLLILEVEIFTA